MLCFFNYFAVCRFHFSDVNESPSGLCDTPIVLGIRTSVGAVIADLNGRDPDNENAINDDPSNKTVFIKLKQGLSYSLNSEQNSWPFRIRGNKLYKSAVSIVIDRWHASVATVFLIF